MTRGTQIASEISVRGLKQVFLWEGGGGLAAYGMCRLAAPNRPNRTYRFSARLHMGSLAVCFYECSEQCHHLPLFNMALRPQSLKSIGRFSHSGIEFILATQWFLRSFFLGEMGPGFGLRIRVQDALTKFSGAELTNV